MLLAEGRGLETIGPKMSSSSLIGAALPGLFPPPSGASKEDGFPLLQITSDIVLSNLKQGCAIWPKMLSQ